jgi:uncharacterized protein (DUF2252 family)
MTASPLALLRGSAPLFYELLERHPSFTEGPAGDGWIVGDAHLENFGAYRAGPLSMRESKETRAHERVVFDLNDFDDAFVGPWRFDVLRLVASLVLGGRELGADGSRTLELSDALLTAYVEAAFDRKKTPPACAPVRALVKRAQSRSRQELLDGRTRIVKGQRRFVRGSRYQELPKKLALRAARAFEKFAKGIAAEYALPEEALEPVDLAFRIAGTGSLGCLRVAVLTRGKGGRDGAWIFDMKEEDAPSAACLVHPPRLAPAERVLTAVRACTQQPPRMAGTTKLRTRSMFVRRLAPQEDKLDLTHVATGDLDPLARHLGSLLGHAHRRGVRRAPRASWSAHERAVLLAHAISLAGVHESMYLAYCALVRP